MIVKRRKKARRKKTLRTKRIQFLITFFALFILLFLAVYNARKIQRVIVDGYFNLFIARKYSPVALRQMASFKIVLPRNYTVHGIDVSKYQKNINWKMVSAMHVGKDSITFVFIKATEGRTMIDPCFDNNWKNAKKNHIIRGAYHYYIWWSNSRKQAENFFEMVDLEKGDLPPVLDIEEVGRYGVQNMLTGIKGWLKLVEQHYGVKPIIYTYLRFYEFYLKGDKDFASYPFWLAHYYKPSLPKDIKWVLWQHSDKGHVDGIAGEVDFNVYNGSKEKFLGICKK